MVQTGERALSRITSLHVETSLADVIVRIQSWHNGARAFPYNAIANGILPTRTRPRRQYRYKRDSTMPPTNSHLAVPHANVGGNRLLQPRGALIKGKYPITTIPHCLPRDVLARRYDDGENEKALRPDFAV